MMCRRTMNFLTLSTFAFLLSATVPLFAQQVRILGGSPTRQAVAALASERPERVEFELPISGGITAWYRMHRIGWTVSWAKDVVMTDEGAETAPLANAVTVYRTELGGPGSDWALVAVDRRGEMVGMVQDNGRRWSVMLEHGQTSRLLVSPEQRSARACGTSADAISAAAMAALRSAGRKTSEAVNANDTLTLELALEVDNDAVRAAGNVNDARLLVSLNMAAVSAVYETELRTKILVSNLRIWDKSNDPYPAQQDVFSLLDTFVEVYMTSMTSVQRDAAVFITSRNAAGGISATIGGLCEPDGAYCAVDIETEAVAYPTWSWNVSVIAHELGHVCGGIHTHSCYWPNGALDSCVTAESGTCFSSDDVKPSRGTIMSYCAANGDPAFEDVLEFHPMHRLVLREYLQSSACVGNQPRSRDCALQGTIRDVETGKPLSGVALKIRPVIDDAYRGTPQPTGDAVVSSKADGTWMFSGLGRGLYAIDIDGPYTIYPAQVGEDAFSFGVAIADSIERKDIWVTRGQIVDITIENDGDTTPTVLNVFSEKISGVLSLVPVPFPEGNATSVHVRRVLPLGRVIIVPSAVGRKFTPTTLRLDVSSDTPQQSATIVSTSVLPELTSTIALAVAEYTRSPVPSVRLARGVSTEITEYGTSMRFKGVTDADGIVVVEDVDAQSSFDAIAITDTNTAAPASDVGYMLPMYDETGAVVLIQPRRRPLIARQYRYRTEAGVFRSLDAPNILRDSKQYGRIVTPVALPFPVRVLDRTLDTMYVHTNGFVSFAARPFPAWAQTPVSMWNDADLVIAALGHDMTLDTNAPNGPRISWAVEGAAPDRTVVIEWRSMTLLNFDENKGIIVDLGRVSFQVRLHEGGDVDIVYDTEIPIPQPVDVQVGIRGNDVLDNQVVRSGGSSDLLQSTAAFDPKGTSRLRLTSTRQFAKGTTFHWELGPTSVYEEASDVTLAPNPVSEALTVRAIKDGARISLVTLQGRVLMSQVSNGSSTSIDVSALPQGAYQAVIGCGTDVIVRPFTVVR
ncbi:MAG: T9SS type A sorting domain-containing protein [Candidatus Kapabacteria bacterium]|nr:T9SS type A sorting domain-containing protein [Candidatus Kapabacteria bacterium]